MENKDKDKINNLIKRLEQQVDNNTSDEENNKIRGVYHINLKKDNKAILDNYYTKIGEDGYNIEVLNNIECKDAADSNKYIIRISNDSGIFYEINLIKYKNMLLEQDFNQYEFIEDVIDHIEGCTNNKEKLIDRIVKILSIIIYDKGLYTITYSVLGFDKLIINNNTSWIFKYDKIYDGDYNVLNGRLLEYDPNIVKRDDLELLDQIQWLNIVSHVMNSHVLDAMLLGAGVSGLIRQILPFSKDSNININICGEPGTGKSTIGHLILSIYGNPQFLEGNFSDTENAIEQLRGNKPILPYIIDDRMLKYIGDSDNKQAVNLLLDIFRESEGRIRERMGSMSADSGKRTYSAVISSSVDSITTALERLIGVQNKDIGQYRRYIEILLDKNDDRYIIASDKEEAEEIEYQAQTNYGFGIEFISRYMLEKLNNEGQDYFIDEFNKINKKISQKLTDNIKASSRRFALIVLSYRVLREALNNAIIEKTNEIKTDDVYEKDENDNIVQSKIIPKPEIIKNNEDKIIFLLVNNLTHKMVSVEASKKPTNNLKTWITNPENLEFFLQCSYVFDCTTEIPNQNVEKKRLLGNINISDDNIEIAYDSKYALESILFSPDLKNIKLKEFYTCFEDVRNSRKSTERLDAYKECGNAVEFYGSNVRDKSSKKKEIKTPIDAFVYNKDNQVEFTYHANRGSYYNENGEVESDVYMTHIIIKK